MFRFGATPASTVPILITNQELNSNGYDLFKGTPGYEDTLTLADNVDGTLTMQPNVAPVSSARTFWVKTFAGTNVLNTDIFNNVVNISNLNVTGVASFNFIAGAIGQNIPSLVVTGVASFNTVYDQNLIVSGAASFSTASAGNVPVIFSNTRLLSATGTINITGIPGGFSTLELNMSGKGTQNAISDSVMIQFNGDGSAVYDDQINYNVGTGYAFSSDANSSQANIALMAGGAAAEANIFSPLSLKIPDYADTTRYKLGLSNFFISGNGAPASGVGGFQWRNTAAITSMAITFISGSVRTFDIGTTVQVILYP